MPASILKTSKRAYSSTAVDKHSVSVGFTRRTRIYLVPDISSYTQEEYDACFSTEADEKRNTNDTVKTITVMRRGSAADRNCEDFCDRGLEHMSSSVVAQQRKENRARVIDSVLDEQEDQWDGGYFDGDRLAAASRNLTPHATDLAAMRAQSDAAIAKRLNPSPVQVAVKDNVPKIQPVKNQMIDLLNNDDSSSDLTAFTTLTSSTSATTSSARTISTIASAAVSPCTPLENAFESVLSTPDFSTITANVQTQSKSIGSVGVAPYCISAQSLSA